MDSKSLELKLNRRGKCIFKVFLCQEGKKSRMKGLKVLDGFIIFP